MISQKLISELDAILKEDFHLFLHPLELNETANSLVEFFDLLFTSYYRSKQEERNATNKS